jgi:hypothetical protein
VCVLRFDPRRAVAGGGQGPRAKVQGQPASQPSSPNPPAGNGEGGAKSSERRRVNAVSRNNKPEKRQTATMLAANR